MHLSLYNCSFVGHAHYMMLVFSCLMRPAAGGFCAAVSQRLLLYSCLLFTQMWVGGVICNMTERCFVWPEDSVIPCLLETNSRGEHTRGTFSLHNILSSSLCMIEPVKSSASFLE